ncbi:autotransporter-associated beta strand repeat-containing protein [Pontiella desulfatans]|nr:autotransporter-associated beta strand repeat-containing protein [Pontiella desulfatans]
MRWLGLALIAFLLAEPAAYGAYRSWKGNQINGNMTQVANWTTGQPPGAGDVMVFNKYFTGNKQPHMNKSFLVEQVKASANLSKNITMSGGTQWQFRIRSLEGIGILQQSGKRLWLGNGGQLWQDNDINPGTSSNTVMWKVTGSNSTLIVDSASIRFDPHMILHADADSNTIDLRCGVIPTTKSVTKTGDGLLILRAANEWAGETVIEKGTLQLAVDQPVSSLSPMAFNHGTSLKTGGYGGDFSTLEIAGATTFDFENLGTSQLSFSDSSGILWTNASLAITNFTEGSDLIRFGTDGNGLAAAQLAAISLNGATNASLNSSGYLIAEASTPTGTERSWQGDADPLWFTAANWAGNTVAGSNEVAAFQSSFASNNFQPTVTADAFIAELRVVDPGQDVAVSVDSNATLSLAHNTEGSHDSIQMEAASRNLVLAGEGAFMQQSGHAADPRWNITGSGDLTIDTGWFGLASNINLTIDVGPLRTVDIKSGAGTTTASIRKTGEGLLILGGENGWQGATTIDAGTLRLATNNAIDANSPLVFNDGTILETGGCDGGFQSLEVNGSVIIDFQNMSSSQLSFPNLSGTAWTAPNLAIANFTESSDSIRFGTDENGLTEEQLEGITLNGSGEIALDREGYLIIPGPYNPQAEFFIDPAVGDDANPGTEAAPFRTIEAARDAVRLINGAMTNDIVVYLRGGTYPIEQTIEFDERDSGTNYFNVVYRNYPNEAPVLEGGEPIIGWTPLSNGIWQAGVGGFEFIQLYVNNKPAQRARYPEAGQENRIEANNNTTDKIQIEHAYVDGVRNLSNLSRVQLVLARSFTLSRVRIASISTSGTYANVTPMEPDRTNHFDVQDKPSSSISGKPSFYFENHFSFLDTPGEWFLDVDADTVYYMPRPGEDLSVMQAVAPKTERLLSMVKTTNTTLFGLTFQHSSWNAPQTEGMVQRQAGLHITPADKDTINPAALYFKKIRNVRIERCIFRQMGGNGINFDTGTQDNMIVGNVFSEIADTAIGYDIDEARSKTQNPNNLSKNDTFDSNYFFHMGAIYSGGGAMFAFWPDSIQIVHNEIAYTGGLGINIGWGAESAATALKAPNISYNRIHDAAVWCRDSGGIHTKSDSSGGIIYKNWIYNMNTVNWWATGPSRTVNGAHLDDNTENYTLQDNVFMNCESHDIRTKSGVYVVQIDNGGQSQTTKDDSGIRPGYRDIKNFHQGGAIGRGLMPGELYEGSESQPLAVLFNNTSVTGSVVEATFAPQAGSVACEFRVKPNQVSNSFYIQLFDGNGRDACKVGFAANGKLRYYYRSDNAADFKNYTSNTWCTIRIEANVVKQVYSLWIDGNLAMGDALFMQNKIGGLAKRVGSIERILLDSGAGSFDIDYIQVEGDAPAGLSTSSGTPRAWLEEHHDTTGWTAADFELFDLADRDGDGEPAWKEWIAGTDPADSASIFKIADTASVAGLSISWNSLAGRCYTVQSAESPAGPWSDVGDSEFVSKPGTGSTIHYFEGTLPESHRFFRIMVSNIDWNE